VILLRPFRRADLDALYQIDQVCFSAGIAYSKAELRYFLQHPKSFSIVAENAPGSIAGFCVAQEYTQEGKRLGHIITIDILPEARQQGTGRALMEAVEAHFRENAIGHMRLEVAVDNLTAQAFYRSLGFEAVGRIRGYYLGRLDAFVMEKTLVTGTPE
jgi:ribosomal-protein-alanine N-acetyltransferase